MWSRVLVGRALERLENPSDLTLIRKQLESPREATSSKSPTSTHPRSPYILTETIRGEAVERSASERRRSEGFGAPGSLEARLLRARMRPPVHLP